MHILKRIGAFIKELRAGRLDRGLMRYFDWWLMLIILAICLFGVVTIFSACTRNLPEDITSVREMLATQDTSYARLQLTWILVGIVAMAAIMFVDYEIYGRFANVLYTLNVFVLLAVLTVEAGRGGMSAFFSWGSTGERGIQPSEFGKVIMIVAMAKAFSIRNKRIDKFVDVIPLAIYVGIPMLLVVAQPDLGTALVYIVIFCVMVFVSGTNWKLIAGVIGVFVVGVLTLWFILYNSGSDNFRLMRILIWLEPENYPSEAWQVINGQNAVGRGGLTGRGIASAGSLASLGFVSDDHTDFIFAICCESFGLVGASFLVILYMLMLGRLIYWVIKVDDPLGSFILVGVISMFLFHVIENIGMVIGLLPVTGIPLPFMSYGGSNMLTCMMAMGLAFNVIMRYRFRQHRRMLRTEIEI